MNQRQLLKATILIIGILIILTNPAAAAAVTYTPDEANATNVTFQVDKWIPAPGAASFTIPVLISTTTNYVYGYTAQNKIPSLNVTLQDKTGWQSEPNAGKLSAGVTSGNGTGITGTGKPLVNITVNITGITDGTYTAKIDLESAYSANPVADVSLNTLNKEPPHTLSFKIKIGNPTPVPTPTPSPTTTPTPSPTPSPTPDPKPTPTRSPGGGGGGGGVTHVPTPILTPTSVLTLTPTAEPTPIEHGPDDGKQPAGAFPIALIAAVIAALIVYALLFPILFPRVSIDFNGQEIRFRIRIGKTIKTAITKHDSSLPVDCWYLNEAKTEPWNPDARIWRKVKLWHRR